MSACGRANPRPVWRCAPLQCLCRLGDMRANPRATPCHQQPPSLGTVTDRGPHRSVDRAPGVCQALHQAQESGHRQITQESDLARKFFFQACPQGAKLQFVLIFPLTGVGQDCLGPASALRPESEWTAQQRGDDSHPTLRAADGARRPQEEGSGTTSHHRARTATPLVPASQFSRALLAVWRPRSPPLSALGHRQAEHPSPTTLPTPLPLN